MIINVHAGHNPDGKVACGAAKYIKESTEARKVKNEVIAMLKTLGHTVYDCTEDNGKSQSDVLQKIVKKCNAHKADLDVSIHFNAGGGRGTEVYVYSSTSKANPFAKAIQSAICGLGYKNRGVKIRTDLYVLKRTSAPALLIECCFVDSMDDVNQYNAKAMATAIVKGITGQTVSAPAKAPEPKPTTPAPAPKVTYYPKYTGKSGSIVDALKSLKIDSSMTNRKKIASKNGISGYSGTPTQNTKMLSLLKSGKLIKP